MKTKRISRPLPAIGWREWVALPELGIARIKVKVDTGARSSALHASKMQRFERDGATWIRFDVHPLQRDPHTTVHVEAPLVDERKVRSSSGHENVRPVVRTLVTLGEVSWPIEVTLVRRDVMGFRMLLGRAAVRRRYLVDCGHSYVHGAPTPPAPNPDPTQESS